MCSATDTFDIALAALDVDICHAVFDGDPADPNAQAQLDFSRTVAFENFVLETNPLVYEFSNIDTTPDDMRRIRTAEAEYFTLFEFSAKYDPVPTMLTQCHTNIVDGFLGQTTAFRQSLIKDSVILLGQEEGTSTASSTSTAASARARSLSMPATTPKTTGTTSTTRPPTSPCTPIRPATDSF